MRYTPSHPFNEADLHISLRDISLQDELGYSGDHNFTVSFHHIYQLTGRGEDLPEHAQLLSMFVHHIQADKVGQEKAAFRQLLH